MRLCVVLILSLFSVSPLFAQQALQDPMWMQQVINVLQAQRNEAMDKVATAQSQFSVAQLAIANLQNEKIALQNELDDQKAKAADLKKQVDDMKAKVEPPAEEKKEP